MTPDEAILVFELNYLRRRCEIQERLIEVWKRFYYRDTHNNSKAVEAVEAELAALDKEQANSSAISARNLAATSASMNRNN